MPTGHSPQWSYRSTDGYSSSNPNTPAIASTTPAGGNSSQLDSTGHSVEHTNPPPAMLSQQAALSPQGPMENELKKQASVSSLRDALLSAPNSVPQQQYSAYSPRVPGGQPSPMTPSTAFPHTPDASTPAGGSTIMSPHMQHRYDDKGDSQLPPESELINSFATHGTEEEGRPLRVSPFQVESILGIRNDKPIDYDSNLEGTDSVDGDERGAVLSPGCVTHGAEPTDDNDSQHRNQNSKSNSDSKGSVHKDDSLTMTSNSEGCGLLQVCPDVKHASVRIFCELKLCVYTVHILQTVKNKGANPNLHLSLYS